MKKKRVKNNNVKRSVVSFVWKLIRQPTNLGGGLLDIKSMWFCNRNDHFLIHLIPMWVLVENNDKGADFNQRWWQSFYILKKRKRKKCHMINLTATIYLLVIFRESRTSNLCMVWQSARSLASVFMWHGRSPHRHKHILTHLAPDQPLPFCYEIPWEGQ